MTRKHLLIFFSSFSFLFLALPGAVAQTSASAPVEAAAPPDKDLEALVRLETNIGAAIELPGNPKLELPEVRLDTVPPFSFYKKHVVHEARFHELPPPIQDVFTQWAGYTKDQPSGQALFEDMFYRFIFVHELGHWLSIQVIHGLPEDRKKIVEDSFDRNYWQGEIVANRFAVAWYREQNPVYLAKLIADFRAILAHLPNPVPAGQKERDYFDTNYEKLSLDAQAYGWYQLEMIVLAYDEPPQSFRQFTRSMPKITYKND